ncbi:hypothetical protein LTR56_003360 [Elasticomyces elasticus]|nr:hypothetical protein LTR56_003360 [Elasticomyces elasticus]KAK3664222.1 hypothetical protein LTR22_004920 [Elasticomyces elasticus]KAK4931437.1 hypothetical protein LTR49_002138 [Elasticomyces elasticus]KAK5766043.1 hypothetical protein LTS12_003789 [Elasticomyces elasticus]
MPGMDLLQHMNDLLATAIATQEAQRASNDSKPTMQHNQTTMAPLVKQEKTPQAADEKYAVTHYDSGIHDSIMLPVYSGSDGKTTMRAVTREELSDAIDRLLSHELATTSPRYNDDRPHSTGATPEPEPKQPRERVSTDTTTFAPARPAAWRDERGPGYIIRHREDNTPATRGHASGSRQDEAPGDFYASQRQQHAASKLQQLGGSAPRKPVARALPQSFVPPSSVRVPSVIPPQQKRPPIIDTEICGVCVQNHGSNDATCDFTLRKAQGHSHCSNCEHKRKNGKPKVQCNRAFKAANKPTVNEQQSSAVGASSTSHKADVISLHRSDRRDSGYGGLPVTNVLSERRSYDSPYPQMPALYGPDLASQMMGSMSGIQMPMPPMLDGAYGMQAPMHGMPGNPYGMYAGLYGMPTYRMACPHPRSILRPVVNTEPLPYAAWLAGYGMQSASQADVQTHDPLRGPMHPDRQMMYDDPTSTPPAGLSNGLKHAPMSKVEPNVNPNPQEEIEKLRHKRKSLAGMTQSIVQRTPNLLNDHMKMIGQVDRSIAKLQKRSRTDASKPSPQLQQTVTDARVRVLKHTHHQLLAEMTKAERQTPEKLPTLKQSLEHNDRELSRLKPTTSDASVMSDHDNSHVAFTKKGFPRQHAQMHKDTRIAKIGQKLPSLLVELDRAAMLEPEKVPILKQKIQAIEFEISKIDPGASRNGGDDASVEDRVVIDLTEETTHDRAASIHKPETSHSISATGQRTLGSDEVLNLVDDLRVSASTLQQRSNMSQKETIGIGNKGIRKLQEKLRLLRGALELQATETIYRRVWSEMLQKLDQKLQSLRGGLEKIRSEQPGRLESHLWMIRTTESALEELRSLPACGANQEEGTVTQDAEQVRGKRKRDGPEGQEDDSTLVHAGGVQVTVHKKARIVSTLPAQTTNEDSATSLTYDLLEDGFPSKTKIMVTNLPYELSEDQLLHMFANYSPVLAKIVLRPIPKFMINKLEARNEPRMGRGFAFVTLASEEMQQKACLEMNGQMCEGREIEVKVAIESAVKATRLATTKDNTDHPMLDERDTAPEHVEATFTAESNRLYIGNIAYATTEADLRSLFEEFCVDRVSVPVNPRTTRSLGYGFVDVSTSAEAERAVAELNGKVVLERKVSVQLARPTDKIVAQEKKKATTPSDVSS